MSPRRRSQGARSIVSASLTASAADRDTATMEEDVDVDQDVDRGSGPGRPHATGPPQVPDRLPQRRLRARSASATSRAILRGSTTSFATRTSSIPAATIASASPTVAHVRPTAEPPSCRFASSGVRWVLTCGRRVLPVPRSSGMPSPPRSPRRRPGPRPDPASTAGSMEPAARSSAVGLHRVSRRHPAPRRARTPAYSAPRPGSGSNRRETVTSSETAADTDP